jgi:hypothetical protein
MVLALVERERGKLATTKLGALSNPTGLEPMRYDARVLAKGDKGTLEVTPPRPVSVIPLLQVNCTCTTTRALRPLIQRWKEAPIESPIRFIIASSTT